MRFIERLKSERKELSEKTEKLMSFLTSEKFNELDSVNKMLLEQQESCMQRYLRILDERTSLLCAEKTEPVEFNPHSGE